MREIKVFSGRANPLLAESICLFLREDCGLNVELGGCSLVTFPDGEFHCKIEDVRGRDVYLIQSTCPPVNDNLMELLIMIDTCRRASAERITVVCPYFGYARQDRKDEGRVPITAKLVANLITEAGADRVLTMDLHAAQIQGFFDVPVDHLYAGHVLNKHFIRQGYNPDDLVIVSPDEGSIKRAVGHKDRLGGSLAIIDKRRNSATEVTAENLIGGPIEGRVAIMFDDMISTAGSICNAARSIKSFGAKEIHVAATHGLFAADAIDKLSSSPIDSIVVTDSIPLPEEKQIPKIKQLTVSKLLGEAIKRIHNDQSISRIFNEDINQTDKQLF
ncbi:MAG: ribose-phosphate pyrophosphokinase [Planctomycetota bacterium]|nr:ribose-phosphate pyrophosphokinase [Planctomycetota bacterium]